jgi:hypothetical protein
MRRPVVLFALVSSLGAVQVGACVSSPSPEGPFDAGGIDFDVTLPAIDVGAPPPEASLDVASPGSPEASQEAAPADTGKDAPPPVDAGHDAGQDATVIDAPVDTGIDATDATVLEASADGGNDAGEAEADAPLDAPLEAEAAVDAGADVEAGPTLIGTGFGKVLDVIADPTSVYFTTYGTTDAGNYDKDGMLLRCPIVGGCAAQMDILGTGLNNPEFLAMDATNIYIGAAGAVGSGASDGYVYACPLSGCGAGNANRVTLSPGLQNLGGITTQAGYVYWVQNPTTATCGRALSDGGGLQWLGNANGYSSVGVTVDDSNAYWTHTYYPPAIHVAPFNGDGGRVLVDIVAVDGGLSPQALTYDNGYLYYVSVLNNEVNRVLVDGGGLETLAAGLNGPYWLALDATYAYVADYYAPGTIRRVPKAGGPATVVINTNLQLTSIAVNDTSVIWSTYLGEVWQIAK